VIDLPLSGRGARRPRELEFLTQLKQELHAL
jgi:hypothetical protein